MYAWACSAPEAIDWDRSAWPLALPSARRRTHLHDIRTNPSFEAVVYVCCMLRAARSRCRAHKARPGNDTSKPRHMALTATPASWPPFGGRHASHEQFGAEPSASQRNMAANRVEATGQVAETMVSHLSSLLSPGHTVSARMGHKQARTFPSPIAQELPPKSAPSGCDGWAASASRLGYLPQGPIRNNLVRPTSSQRCKFTPAPGFGEQERAELWKYPRMQHTSPGGSTQGHKCRSARPLHTYVG